jgi:hypothetical protein
MIKSSNFHNSLERRLSEKSEIVKVIEETLMQHDNLSEAQKEEILEGADTDAK